MSIEPAPLADARQALAAVREIHQDGGESQGYIGNHYGDMPHACTTCGELGEYGVAWPCATYQAASIDTEKGTTA